MDLESLTDILVLGFLTSTQPTDLVRNAGKVFFIFEPSPFQWTFAMRLGFTIPDGIFSPALQKNLC
jgi:hypothetical protein